MRLINSLLVIIAAFSHYVRNVNVSICLFFSVISVYVFPLPNDVTGRTYPTNIGGVSLKMSRINI